MLDKGIVGAAGAGGVAAGSGIPPGGGASHPERLFRLRSLPSRPSDTLICKEYAY